MRSNDGHSGAHNVDHGAPFAGPAKSGDALSTTDPWGYARSGPWQLPAVPDDQMRLLPAMLRHAFDRDGREGLRGWEVDPEGSLGPGVGPFLLGEADHAREEAILGGGKATLVLKSGEILTASGHHFFALLALNRASCYGL